MFGSTIIVKPSKRFLPLNTTRHANTYFSIFDAGFGYFNAKQIDKQKYSGASRDVSENSSALGGGGHLPAHSHLLTHYQV